MSSRRRSACGKHVYFIAFLLGIQMKAMRIDSNSVSNICRGSMRGSNPTKAHPVERRFLPLAMAQRIAYMLVATASFWLIAGNAHASTYPCQTFGAAATCDQGTAYAATAVKAYPDDKCQVFAPGSLYTNRQAHSITLVDTTSSYYKIVFFCKAQYVEDGRWYYTPSNLEMVFYFRGSCASRPHLAAVPANPLPSNTLTCYQGCEYATIEGGFQPPTGNVCRPPEPVINSEKNNCCSAESASGS
jgi:hypothetical protein